MKPNFYILSAAQHKTRRDWKKYYFILFLLHTSFFLFWSMFSIKYLDGDAKKLGRATSEIMIWFLFPAIIYYHCAYKKAGSSLVTLYLFLKPVEMLFKVAVFFYLPYGLIINMLLLAATVPYYLLNWKLRKVNKKLQFNLLYPDEYLLQTSNLFNTDLVDNLDTVYANLVQSWPQFEKYSTYLYERAQLNRQELALVK